MPIILLGLLVIAGLLAYMYFTGSLGNSGRKEADTDNKPDTDDDTNSVIYLPNDIEKEKKKRNVKTGK